MKLGKLPLKKCMPHSKQAGGDAGAQQGQPEADAQGDNVEDVDFEEVK